MAMLIDAATEGVRRPKGCAVRRRVRPSDVVGGLTLGQVAAVAANDFGVPIANRSGSNAITVKDAIKRVRGGRGFVLQGNNLGWGLNDVNHAIYVHEVRGGTADRPEKALVYDPQRKHERWIDWPLVVGFGGALKLKANRTLGEGVFFAGFAPKPLTPAAIATRGPVQPAGDGVELGFGARKLPRPDRTVAHAPRGRLVNVRDTPRSLAAGHVVDTLRKGDVFVAFQKTRGVKPAGAASSTWFGNKDATQWVHVSGLRKIGDGA
jgi:hypothetical protein